MTDVKALTELRDKVQDGALHKQPHGGMPMATAIYSIFGDNWSKGPWSDRACINAYNGSLDAAKSLHEALLPEWFVYSIDQDSARRWYVTLCHQSTGGAKSGAGKWQHFGGECLARAWLLAILSALIEEADQ